MFAVDPDGSVVCLLVHNTCWGRYLDGFGTDILGHAKPAVGTMVRPHAHHILFKRGNGTAQKELVAEGFAILNKYDIDPVRDPRNLVWAPNIKGQHGIEMLEKVLVDLRVAHRQAGGKKSKVLLIEEALRTAGERARNLK